VKTYNIKYIFQQSMESLIVNYLENMSVYDYLPTLYIHQMDLKSLENSFHFSDLLLENLVKTKNF
jgi:hypothetical protein